MLAISVLTTSNCESEEHLAITTESSGYIHLTSDCTWRIDVNTGQHINITIYNFQLCNRQQSMHGIDCESYAVIQQPSVEVEDILCASYQRVSDVFLSQRNIVDITFPATNHDGSSLQFILKYEAITCDDLSSPPNSHVSISHGIATVTNG